MIRISSFWSVTSHILVMPSIRIGLDAKRKGAIIINSLRLGFLSEAIHLINPIFRFIQFLLWRKK